METLDVLASRVSAQHFDPERQIDPDELRDLVRLACRAPSAFNLQHWRFLAVTDPVLRSRLEGLAPGQAHLGEAPVVLVVLGDLRAEEMHEEALRATVEKGGLSEEQAEAWMAQASKVYARPQAARDEAVRSASFAGMCLMLAARDRGLASSPAMGFDAESVREVCGISERYLPVLLVALGHPRTGDTQRQKVRLGLGKVLFEGDGEALPE